MTALALLGLLVAACSADGADEPGSSPTVGATRTPQAPASVESTAPTGTPTPSLTAATTSRSEPPLWNTLVRPVLDGPEALVRLGETVSAACSYHGELMPACLREGKGLHEQFEGIILSDVLSCEGCIVAREDLADLLRRIYDQGTLQLIAVWEVSSIVTERLERRGDGLTASLAFEFRAPDASVNKPVTGFLVYVDQHSVSDAGSPTPIQAVEWLSHSWTGADTALELGGWEQIYPLP